MSCLLSFVGGSFSIASGQEMVLSYDFESGDLQGWENVSTSTTAGGPTSFGAFYPAGGEQDVAPQPFSTFVGPTPFGDSTDLTRDQAHNTLVLRSPTFLLESGDISFSLSGGMSAGSAPASFASLPADSSTSGFLGVALRRASDGVYLMTASRSANNKSWETITWSGAALSGYVSDSEVYTLDLIDTHDGSWGWVGMDNVSIAATPIPEPSTYALFFGAVAGAALLIRRQTRGRD